ncbi:hypothetical protein LCGC14_1519780 [marine sediment metagenome]|uniref:Uncharacterized protein n=1 Tax=marine sediment metagenome TaxID=412755 RepID=A0A0F9IZ63_9ZZZZ
MHIERCFFKYNTRFWFMVVRFLCYIFGLTSLVIGGIPVIFKSFREVFHKNFTADILFSIALIATLE